MVRRIRDEVRPDRIILFGSYARGTAGPDSDVDLLVILRDATPKRRKTAEIYRLLAGSGLPKDIIVATHDETLREQYIPGSVIGEAVREGVVVYDAAAS
ncbi:nucleotidyltransferase domain-containing protein [Candidatus Poribacteria bacterium]|nr:nucleotidyltransferase domain-containing protein [Candidatus Poribacteria bacterium]